MEAVVRARMKGGDSSTMGGTVEGMVTMWRASMKERALPSTSRKAARRPPAGGWSFSRSCRICSGVRLGSISAATRFNSAWLRWRSS